MNSVREIMQADATVTTTPKSRDELGVSDEVLLQLLIKQLYVFNGMSLAQTVDSIKLSTAITESLAADLRARNLMYVAGSADGSQPLTYTLTELGRLEAENLLTQNSYSGPAPISLASYRQLIQQQSIRNLPTTKADLERCYSGICLDQDIKDRLGPAIVSGKSLFLYGPAGTGKTFIAQKINDIFGDSCLIPYAIEIQGQILAIFDPILHSPVLPSSMDESDPQSSLRKVKRQDPRLIACKRPRIIVGGEMTVDMLDVQFDPYRKNYVAPLQLKANSGVFIIDDMGRQKSTPMEIFNRWIVPMEEKQDYLSIGSGQHFSVPFDQLLVFSSNISPLELADEAFLRRIGYKICISPIGEESYKKIWLGECERLSLQHCENTLQFVLHELHKKRNIALLPCHPRDLLEMASDHAAYTSDEQVITCERLSWAWDSYFVSLDTSIGHL